jgi:3-isopropylmalate/(R)-2-methylmalate dehydratase small subunit
MDPIRIIESRTVVLPRENVDTDQIIPARFLKTTEKRGLGTALFSDWRYDAEGRPRPEFVLNRPEAEGCAILVAGDNFGCGSSREHAPWALVAAPGARVRIDLAAQTVTLPDGTTASFPVDAFSRYCLMNGVDELGYLLSQEAAIAAHERSRA